MEAKWLTDKENNKQVDMARYIKCQLYHKLAMYKNTKFYNQFSSADILYDKLSIL